MKKIRAKTILASIVLIILLLFCFWEITYFVPRMAIESRLHVLGFDISDIKIENIGQNIYELENPPLNPNTKQPLKYWKLTNSNLYSTFQQAEPLSLEKPLKLKQNIFFKLPMNDYLKLKDMADAENKSIEEFIREILIEKIKKYGIP